MKSLGLTMVRWPVGMAETNIEDISGHLIPVVGIVSIFVSGGKMHMDEISGLVAMVRSSHHWICM